MPASLRMQWTGEELYLDSENSGRNDSSIFEVGKTSREFIHFIFASGSLPIDIDLTGYTSLSPARAGSCPWSSCPAAL